MKEIDNAGDTNSMSIDEEILRQSKLQTQYIDSIRNFVSWAFWIWVTGIIFAILF